MKFYDGMKLPDLTGFRRESVESPKRSMPRPLDMKALKAMEAAVPELAQTDPGAYVAHLLFSRIGLRNSRTAEAYSLNCTWESPIKSLPRTNASAHLAPINCINKVAR